MLLLLALVAALPDDAVVRVEGCSGVCVDARGLVLTAKHCDLPDEVHVVFSGRGAVPGRVVHRPRATEGAVAISCAGSDFPALRVAASAPANCAPVASIGWPKGTNGRMLARCSGKLLGGVTANFRDEDVELNAATLHTWAGWSGGPIFNAAGEVVGLVGSWHPDERWRDPDQYAQGMQSDPFKRSDSLGGMLCVPWTSVIVAYRAGLASLDQAPPAVALGPAAAPANDLPPAKPALQVFTDPTTCLPCRRFETDLQTHPTLRKQIEAAFRLQICKPTGRDPLPTFLIVATGRRIEGYTNADTLLQQLGLQPKPAAVVPQTPAAELTDAPPWVRPAGDGWTAVEVPERPPSPVPLPFQPSPAGPAAVTTPPPRPEPPVQLPPLPAEPPPSPIERGIKLVTTGLTVWQILQGAGTAAAIGGPFGVAAYGAFAVVRWFAGRRRSTAKTDQGHHPEARAGPAVVVQKLPEVHFAPYETNHAEEDYVAAVKAFVATCPEHAKAIQLFNAFRQHYRTQPR